jgi:aspartate/methionine/tyrosine aminotransferase
VATVPGSSFDRPGAVEGQRYVRFAFCKSMATLERAVERLSRL